MVASEKKRVLLTGASGFVGRQVIAPLLGHGFEVHVAGRSPAAAKNSQVHTIDLLNQSAVSKLFKKLRPSHLVHLAWYMKSPDFWESRQNEDWVLASAHLFDEFVKNGGERLVGGGTCAEYEWGSDVLKEVATPENPSTGYGKAKVALRVLAESLANKSNISFVWARVFFLFGPHEQASRFVPSIIDPLLRGAAARCRHGDLERDFLYSEDAGDAIAALAHSAVEGTVNIGSGEATSLESIAREIGSAMRSEELVEVANVDDNEGQVRTIKADVTRLRAEVGWTPRHSLTQGLERTIAWRSEATNLNAV